MKKWLGRLTIALALTSSGANARIHKDIKVHLDFDKTYIAERALVGDVHLSVVPEELRYQVLSDGQEARFERAVSLLEETLNSEEFKQKVLSYKRSDGKRLYQNNFLWGDETRTLSNEDVFNLIKNGDEKTIPGTVGEMNVYALVRRFMPWSDTIGYTKPRSSELISLNYYFYRNYDAPTMVNNLVHEWIHLLGFLHGNEKLGEEAPYVIGEIAEVVSRKILESRR